MIPVEVTQTPWHYTTFWDWLDHWQTLIAGVLAFAAGFGTVVAAIGAIWVTRSTARRQIDASGEDARSVIAATRDLTEGIFKQTETTVRLEETRNKSQALAFRVMLKAAMARVLAEAKWARETYPNLLTPQTAGASPEALVVRPCITKGGFAQLRAVCVRQGSDLTGEFLELEREIDSFALQCEDRPSTLVSVTIRMGKRAGLGEQLALIEAKAAGLCNRAAGKRSASRSRRRRSRRLPLHSRSVRPATRTRPTKTAMA